MTRAASVSFTHSDVVRRLRGRAQARAAAPGSMSDDLRLFATTFGAGFLFVSLFLA
jgi:hypothetical protein